MTTRSLKGLKPERDKAVVTFAFFHIVSENGMHPKVSFVVFRQLDNKRLSA